MSMSHLESAQSHTSSHIHVLSQHIHASPALLSQIRSSQMCSMQTLSSCANAKLQRSPLPLSVLLISLRRQPAARSTPVSLCISESTRQRRLVKARLPGAGKELQEDPQASDARQDELPACARAAWADGCRVKLEKGVLVSTDQIDGSAGRAACRTSMEPTSKFLEGMEKEQRHDLRGESAASEEAGKRGMG